MAKQGCNEQKLSIRPIWLGNMALDIITRLQAEAHVGKLSMTLRRRYVLPWEISYYALHLELEI